MLASTSHGTLALLLAPFFLNYGQHPWKGIEPRGNVHTPDAEEFAKNMKKIREEAAEYKVGDMVYVEGVNIISVRPAKKLDDKRYGPSSKSLKRLAPHHTVLMEMETPCL